MLRASATGSVRVWPAIDHPASRREERSMTVAIEEIPIAHGEMGDVALVLRVGFLRGEVPLGQARHRVSDGSGTLVLTW